MTAVLAAVAMAVAPVQGQQPHAPLAHGGYAFQLYFPPGALATKLNRYPLMMFEGSFFTARAIRTCGGTPLPDHLPSWDAAYDNPAPYLWLLEQRRPANNKDRK